MPGFDPVSGFDRSFRTLKDSVLTNTLGGMSCMASSELRICADMTFDALPLMVGLCRFGGYRTESVSSR